MKNIVRAGCIVQCQGKYLLVMENSSCYWGFPKGRINPGETPEEAALRELREETNIQLQISNLGRKLTTKDGVFYHIKLDKFPLIRTCSREILAFHWANIDHLRLQHTSILTKSVLSKIGRRKKKLITNIVSDNKAATNGQKSQTESKSAGQTGKEKGIYSKQDCRYCG